MKNPRTVSFVSEDHDRVTGYEVDFAKHPTGEVVQTLELGRGEVVDGKVVLAVNVHPIEFGNYVSAVRATADEVESDTSEPSEVWQRAPGKPSAVTVGL